jgi:hypothetical protein
MNRYVVSWLIAVVLACVLRYISPNLFLGLTVASAKGPVGVGIRIGTVGFWVITLLATGILGYMEIRNLIASAKASME